MADETKQIYQYTDGGYTPERDHLLLVQPGADTLYQTLTPAQLLALLLASDLPSHASTHARDGTDAIASLGQVEVRPLADGTLVFTVKNAAGTATVLSVNTTANTVVIDGNLEVTGRVSCAGIDNSS